MYAIIHNIEPFDAKKGSVIQFSWNGNQIFQVRCIIKENETGNTVYDNTISSMKQQFEVPSDSGLINGINYIAYITVFDVNGEESSLQDIGTPFYCFSTPTFQVSILSGDIVRASTYPVTITYEQLENEILDSYEITLYSYSKRELQSSGIIYDVEDSSYVISGLENANQYYIRATGTTLHGMTLDTGMILFSVSYTQAQMFTPLELNNKSEIGAIEIKSNLVSTLATSEKDVEYIDGDRADLRDNSITYDIGFEVEGDNTGIYLFSSPNVNKSIIKFTTESISAEVIYRKGIYSDSDGEKSYFELQVNSGQKKYVIFSNYIDTPSDDQQFCLLVNRREYLFDLKVITI